jgi:fumarate reductase subunit D
MAKSTGETWWWSLFAAGGVVAALFVPALIFITGLLIPFLATGGHGVRSDRLARLVTSIPGRLLLFAVISLSLFHCVHRIRHTLKDLGLHGGQTIVATVCYGSAILGTLLAGWLVATL